MPSDRIAVMGTHRYRGRIAPSPTGYLHLGHARTFWRALERAREHAGVLIFRNEDLDPQRCRPEFVNAMFEDLRWYGIKWQEGPDVGGAFGPYVQSERRDFYLDAWRKLKAWRMDLSVLLFAQGTGAGGQCASRRQR